MQAALYWRYLDQIDEDLRPLAHPGLILRRIDADVILNVLAAPCGLSVVDEADAHRLFDRLREEVTLVGPNQDGTDAVRHRSDVRRFMLGLMQRDNPNLAKLINQRAIDYYAALSDRSGNAPPWARAEEVYHRLLSCENVTEVDARWVPGLGTYLQDAVDELPIRSKIYLANKLGLSLQEDDRREASLEEQEQSIANEAERFITAGSIETALSILAAQSDRSPTSPLYRLEARALSLAGQSMEALAKADAAAEAASLAGDKRGLAEMLVLSAELSFRQDELANATAFLEKAVSLYQETVDAARLVSALVLLVRVYDARTLTSEKREAVRQLEAARERMKTEVSGSTEAPTRLAQEAAQAADVELALAPVPSLPEVSPERPAPEADVPFASSSKPTRDSADDTRAEGDSHPDSNDREPPIPDETGSADAGFGNSPSRPESLDQLFTTFNRGLSS